MDVLSQADYGRRVDGQFLGVKHVAVVLFRASYPLKDHHHGAPLGAHVDGLKRGVQD
jgi:hypothetical protein